MTMRAGIVFVASLAIFAAGTFDSEIAEWRKQRVDRLKAKWVADPKEIPVLNIIGITEPMKSPGVAVFRLKGKEYRVRPVLETADAQELFYIFKDETSGKETYGAGRFLYSEMPKDGT